MHYWTTILKPFFYIRDKALSPVVISYMDPKKDFVLDQIIIATYFSDDNFLSVEANRKAYDFLKYKKPESLKYVIKHIPEEKILDDLDYLLSLNDSRLINQIIRLKYSSINEKLLHSNLKEDSLAAMGTVLDFYKIVSLNNEKIFKGLYLREDLTKEQYEKIYKRATKEAKEDMSYLKNIPLEIKDKLSKEGFKRESSLKLFFEVWKNGFKN